MLRRVLASTAGAKAFGPVTQAHFLASMGMPTRLEALINREDVSDAQAEALVDSYSFLVDEEKMGERFKVLAIVDSKQKHAPPGGFEEGENSLDCDAPDK